MRYSSPKPVSNVEFKRRVFNSALCECFANIHAKCLGIHENATLFGYYPDANEEYLAEMASSMAKAFCREELNLDRATINDTKKTINAGGNTFIAECVALCEEIANDKMVAAVDSKVVATDDMKEPELNPEEKELIKNLFDRKDPEVEADAVRDATVKALLAEREKANKIKEATSIAQQAGDANKLEETVNRIASRGATSLMHALLTSISEAAVRDVHDKNPQAKIGEILSENADEINTRAAIIYSLYEAFNAFGIKKYTKRDIETLSRKIYNGE